jgi:hypothetical protein
MNHPPDGVNRSLGSPEDRTTLPGCLSPAVATTGSVGRTRPWWCGRAWRRIGAPSGPLVLGCSGEHGVPGLARREGRSPRVGARRTASGAGHTSTTTSASSARQTHDWLLSASCRQR